MTGTSRARRRDTVVFPAGRELRATGVPGALAAWLEDRWPDRPPALDRPVRVELVGLGDPPEGGLPQEGTPIPLPSPVSPWSVAGDTLWSVDAAGGVVLTLDPGGPRIEFWGKEGWARSRPTARILNALLEVLRATGVHPFHASAAVPPGREGCVAFLGRHRAGKSVAVAHAAEAGWSPLGEDLLWLDPETRTVHGDDRGVHLRPGGLSLMDPGVTSASAPSRGGRKRHVTFSDLGADRRHRAPLLALVHLRRNRARTGCTRLPRRDCARLLWQATGIPLSVPGRLDYARAVPGVVDAVPAFRLSFSEGPLPLSLLEEALGPA